jgi:hypothetical protein
MPGEEEKEILALSSFETADGQSHLLADVALFTENGGCSCAFTADQFQPYLFETLV